MSKSETGEARLENHRQGDAPLNNDPLNNAAGIILCGGKSSRMGSPKEWLEFGNERMLQRMSRILGELLDPVIVVAAADQEIPTLDSTIQVVTDEFDSLGPLSGIYSGLKQIHRRGIGRAFVTACDCPFIQADFIRFLFQQIEADTQIVLTTDGQHHHVLSAVYDSSVYQSAEQLIEEQKLRPIRLTDLHPTKWIHLDAVRAVDPELLSLENMNSPAHYQAALERFSRLETR